MENKYFESLDLKLKIAEYNFSQIKKTYISAANNEEKYIACTSEFIAMMLTLQSSLDVLAQIVDNRNKQKVKNNVYFMKVIPNTTDPILKSKLEELKKASEYTRDFCNTIKHINIIKVSDIFFISPVQPVGYLTIDSFKYTFKNTTRHHE